MINVNAMTVFPLHAGLDRPAGFPEISGLYAPAVPDKNGGTDSHTSGAAMPSISRASLLLLAVIAAGYRPAEAAAQANRQTLNQVSQFILRAHKFLSEENDTKSARAECEKAKAIDVKTNDPFIAANVHACFGDVADYEENTAEACRQYAHALREFKAVPAKHSAQRTLRNHINVTEGKRLTLNCDA
jgi:hypothetical protein